MRWNFPHYERTTTGDLWEELRLDRPEVVAEPLGVHSDEPHGDGWRGPLYTAENLEPFRWW